MSAPKRLADTMTAQDLNSDGCVDLVAAVLTAAAEEYRQVRRCLRAQPFDADTYRHYLNCRDFWTSHYFRRLTGGLVDGRAILQQLDMEGEI